jgi:hypothetical protein
MMLLDSTSPSDRTPWRQAQLARFDGTSWVPFGGWSPSKATSKTEEAKRNQYLLKLTELHAQQGVGGQHCALHIVARLHAYQSFRAAECRRRFALISRNYARCVLSRRTRGNPPTTPAREQIAADCVDAVERGHHISCTVDSCILDPGHCSGARYERAAKDRSRRRAF